MEWEIFGLRHQLGKGLPIQSFVDFVSVFHKYPLYEVALSAVPGPAQQSLCGVPVRIYLGDTSDRHIF